MVKLHTVNAEHDLQVASETPSAADSDRPPGWAEMPLVLHFPLRPARPPGTSNQDSEVYNDGVSLAGSNQEVYSASASGASLMDNIFHKFWSACIGELTDKLHQIQKAKTCQLLLDAKR